MFKFITPYSAANTSYTGTPNGSSFQTGTYGNGAAIFNASSVYDINRWVDLSNELGAGVVNPEVFYSKQLLDTIRYDADKYTYYRYADEQPIQGKADKLVLRRWSPLRAHTVPLVEGVPPQSDKGVAKKYEIQANAYGRYMEFTDAVDFKCVDPVVAFYSNQYSIVAIETLDLLAQEALLATGVEWFAGSNATAITDLAPNGEGSKPQIADFRLMGLYLKRNFIKPRSNGKYHAIVSPEFTFDMLDDEYVKNYMTINQSTYNFYDNGTLTSMFGFDFYEVDNCPVQQVFLDSTTHKVRVYCDTGIDNVIADSSKVASGWTYVAAVTTGNNKHDAYIYKDITISSATISGGYDRVDTIGIKGSQRTYGQFSGLNQSYIPTHDDWDMAAWAAIAADTDCASTSTSKVSSATGETNLIKDNYKVMQWQCTVILGKDAMVRTGLAGEGQARMYVKALGSAGVLDPIDQRQSIGFKINSVGFSANVTQNAVIVYKNIPSQLLRQ